MMQKENKLFTLQSNDLGTLQAILDISKELYLSRTYEDLGKRLFDNLPKLEKHKEPTGKLVIYDSVNHSLVTVYKREKIQHASVPDFISVKDIKYFSKIVFESKELLFIENSHSEYSLSIDPRQKLNPPSSLVFIPLFTDEEFVGIFSYASQPENSVTPDFLTVLTTVANIITVVLRQIKFNLEVKKEMQANELLNRQLIGVLNEFALLVDTNDIILMANDSVNEAFPDYNNNINGKCLWDIIPEVLVPAQKKCAEQVKSSLKPAVFQWRFDNRWFEQKLFPILDEFGKLFRVACFISDISDSKLAYEKLNESQRELKTLFANLPGLAFRCRNDKLWTMEFLSQGCEDLTGYKVEELLNNSERSYSGIIHSEDAYRVWEEVQQNLKQKRTYDLNYRIITKQKRIKWVLENATGVYDEKGELLFIEGIVLEITKRKVTEILKEVLFHVNTTSPSESGFNEFLETMYTAINKTIDAKNCFVALHNPKTNSFYYPLYKDQYYPSPVERDLRKGKTEVVFKTGKPFIATKDTLQQYISSGEIEIYNEKCKSWIGTPISINNTIIGVFAIRNYESESYFDAADFDITIPIANNIAFIYERMRAEEEKKILENRFRAIWEKSADCLRLIDSDGTILLVNNSFCKVVGLSREELIGKSFAIIYPETMRAYMQKKFRENIANGKIIRNYQKRAVLWNEKVIWFEVSNSILELENENTMVMSIMRDISQEKLLEEQLVQSQKMESIGRLAGGVAHDFNNILTVILGNSEMIKRLAKDDSKISGHAEKIIIASQRGSDISKQLLSFAKLNKQVILPVNLNEIVTETTKLLEHSLKKKVEIIKELDYSIEKIDADYGNIQQVIMNLTINARDAIADEGFIKIKTGKKFIDADCLEKPADLPSCEYVFFSIEDNGTGIPENIKKHIFEPFFTTKDNSRGTGLGLAIVYGIIKSHNGFVVLDTELSKGSVFTVYFPPSKLKIDAPVISGNIQIPVGNYENILLVDDEELILEIGKEILSALNFYPLTANSGAEALRIYEQMKDRIKVIIIDQIMPEKNGSEIARIIKAINPDVKIILSSGTSDPSIEEYIKEYKLAGFIQKPYKIEELSLLLSEMFLKK